MVFFFKHSKAQTGEFPIFFLKSTVDHHALKLVIVCTQIEITKGNTRKATAEYNMRHLSQD